MKSQEYPLRVSALMPLALGFCTLILIFGVLGVWLSRIQIAGAVIAEGRIETSVGPHLVSHAAGGIVERLIVSEGQRVDRGDLLLQLDASALDLLLTSASEQIAELLARRMRLEAERDGRKTLHTSATVLGRRVDDFPGLRSRLDYQHTILAEHDARISRESLLLDQRTLQVENQTAGIKAITAALKQEVELLQEELDRQNEMMGRGLIQRNVVIMTQRELLRKSGELKQLSSQHAELLDKLVESRMSASGIKDLAASEAQAELDRIEPQLLTLLERHGDLELERDLLAVHAPISGYVHDVQVLGKRFFLKPGAPILTIISDAPSLNAVIRVAPRDIDQVQLGQSVGLQFRSYNRRSVPLLNGIVERVAPDASIDPVTRQTYFEVFVGLPYIAPETRMQLVSGMELTAFLKTEDETPLEYVTRPLFNYLNLAMRDR